MLKVLLSVFCIELPMVVMVITALIPMMIPSMVRKERILFIISEVNAILMLSKMFIRPQPPSLQGQRPLAQRLLRPRYS